MYPSGFIFCFRSLLWMSGAIACRGTLVLFGGAEECDVQQCSPAVFGCDLLFSLWGRATRQAVWLCQFRDCRSALALCHPNMWGMAIAPSGAFRATSACKPHLDSALFLTMSGYHVHWAAKGIRAGKRKMRQGWDERLSHPWIKCLRSRWKSGKGTLNLSWVPWL